MIKNVSKNTAIAKNFIRANDFKKKLFGRLAEKETDALILNTHFGVHTFFMKKPIDILVLDSSNRVVDLKVNLLPYRIFTYNPKYKTIIELKQGQILSSKTEIGDKIGFF